jgi:hypothetical protein
MKTLILFILWIIFAVLGYDFYLEVFHGTNLCNIWHNVKQRLFKKGEK